MAPNIKNQLNQKFSFTTGSWLNWADEAPTLTQKEESEESQSIDSDRSDDFFHNFNQTIEHMIIARRATYLKELEERIAKDNLTLKKLTKRRKPKQTRTPTEQLNDRLDKLENDIETAIAKAKEENKPKPGPSEQFYGQKQQPRATTPPKVRIVNLLKEKSPFATYWKFPCQPDGKEPRCRWRQHECQQKPGFSPNRFNTGIPTGPRNNLLVVDVDVKDDGVREFRKYRREFGTPETLTVKTPSGGNHYYFNYSHGDPDTDIMIRHYLKNKTKYRGKGLDIRTEGGYVCAPPSVVNGVAYEVTRSTRPIDLPPSLLKWLLEEAVGEESTKPGKKAPTTTRTTAQETAQVEYDFDLSEATAHEILNELGGTYQTNFSDWFLVTGILKKHDLKQVWTQWSQPAANYNQAKNEQIWQSRAPCLDINYLVWLLRKNGSKRAFVEKWKPYHPIAKERLDLCKQMTFNAPYVTEGFSKETFDNHETIIIKSCTGTGKTHAVAKHMEQEVPYSKFLSITTRTTLADQHQKSFAAIRMENYQDVRVSLYDADVLGVCLNSLIKLEALEESEIADYVVYIDEVSSFTEFVNNDLLDNILKRLVCTLTRIVRHARKVIVSDALINDSTFELLKHRPLKNTVFLTNEFKKFKAVPAVRLRNEEEFLSKLVEHCNADKPFLFGADSCTVATAFYHHCLQNTPAELHHKFLLITAETKYRVKDATHDFEGKFVFYSPKITFGVDFSTLVSQDVFIHITGFSIQPSGSYQQATRCRNIKTLYYFGECTTDSSIYNSLEEVRADVEKAIATSQTFNTTCTYLDENDEVQVVKNTFFNLYCLNELTRDTYASNRVRHFELILLKNGFELTQEGEKQVISASGMMEEINEKTFEDFQAEPKGEGTWNTSPKYQQLLTNIFYLKLNPIDHEALNKYQEIVMNRRRVEEHDALMRFLKSDEFVNDKLADLSMNCLEAKALTNPFQMIKVARLVGAKWGYSLLEDKPGEFNKLDEGLYKLVKHAFRLHRPNPENQQDAGKMYEAMVNKATWRNFLKCSKGDVRWNIEVVKKHLELSDFKNPMVSGFAPLVVAKFGLTPSELPKGLYTFELDEGI